MLVWFEGWRVWQVNGRGFGTKGSGEEGETPGLAA